MALAHASIGGPAPDARAGESGRAHVELDENLKEPVVLRGDAQVEHGCVGDASFGQPRRVGRDQKVSRRLRCADAALKEW